MCSQDVQAFDPHRHPTGRSAGYLGNLCDRLSAGEVVAVRLGLPSSEIGINAQSFGHGTHHPARLEPADR
jgi:hypothetical protein